MAEVLITLAIIGIVAAMTIPTLISNYQKKQTVSKLQKVNAVLSQMIIQSYSDNGLLSQYIPAGSSLNHDVSKDFFENYILKYFKISSVSADGDYPYLTRLPFYYRNAINYEILVCTSYIDGRIYFTTADGISYLIMIKTEKKEYDDEGNVISSERVYNNSMEVYADLNGTSQPNLLGKDIFEFVVDFTNNSVKPYGYQEQINVINLNCSLSGTGEYCAAKIIHDGWKIMDDYPW